MQTITIPVEYRPDCYERYHSIKQIDNFSGKSLIDIGCANGYFMAKFLSDGGRLAIGVEPLEKYRGEGIVRDISDVSGHFDICFYLDLHYHKDINYFPWIKEHVDTLYTAPSGVGNNEIFREDLLKEFGNCEFVSCSNYAYRNIYRVNVCLQQ